MDPVRAIRLHWVQGALSDASYHLMRFRFSRYSPHAWQPAINAYRCESCFRICIDLAGVEKSEIDLQIEPRRVWLSGTRNNPEPAVKDHRTIQTIAMEIDYGPFIRSISLPAEIDPEKAAASQENGFLWISLPIKNS
jgi:HSP20 family protein